MNLIGLTAILLAAHGGAVTDRSDYYSRSGTPAVNHPNWMRRIADSKSLAALSIPGTHDSCALHGGDIAECQSLTISEQLKSGIRFLDIRCRQTESSYAIHHGAVYQQKMFGDILNECKTFLDAHASECILMRVKNEKDPPDPLRPVGTWASVFNTYKNNSSRYWYTSSSVPTLGSVRGKIVLVTGESGIGGISTSGFDTQDDWNLSTIFARGRKWNEIKDQLDAARNGSLSTFYWNFSSASSSAGAVYPNAVAIYENERVYEHLGTTNARWGSVMMDFPGGKLIERLINSNF